MTYATRECHDCGRLSSRDTMKRHKIRQKAGNTVSIDAKTGTRRVSSERYANRDILVCAKCGKRRAAISNLKTASVLVISAVVIGLILINSSQSKDEEFFLSTSSIENSSGYVDPAENVTKDDRFSSEMMEKSSPSPQIYSNSEAGKSDEAIEVLPSETPHEPADDLTDLY